jgi:phage terminase Nu1 subunit (DNA packaging protein)
MPKEVKKDISDMLVNTDVLADLFGFTRQRINQLAKEGILEKQAAGRYPLKKNVQRYIDYLRTGRGGSESEDAEAKLTEEKFLHEKAKREIAELKLARLRNQLHSAADVELVLTNMLVTFRNRILGIPDKVAPKVIGITNLSEISDVINTELLQALTELSEYDPSMFMEGGDDESEDTESIPEDSEIGGTTAEINDQ